jgi:hypothetical protein
LFALTQVAEVAVQAVRECASHEVVENAIWVLGNIAGDGQASREELYRLGAVQALTVRTACELGRLGYFPFGVRFRSAVAAAAALAAGAGAGVRDEKEKDKERERAGRLRFTTPLLKVRGRPVGARVMARVMGRTPPRGSTRVCASEIAALTNAPPLPFPSPLLPPTCPRLRCGRCRTSARATATTATGCLP